MKRNVSIEVLKERIALAAMTNCIAGGSRKINMINFAKHVGLDHESADIEKLLRSYVRKHIDGRHARRLLTWMITTATYQDEIARPPVGVPKVRSEGSVSNHVESSWKHIRLQEFPKNSTEFSVAYACFNPRP